MKSAEHGTCEEAFIYKYIQLIGIGDDMWVCLKYGTPRNPIFLL